MTTLHPADLVERIDAASGLDRVAEPIQRGVAAAMGDGSRSLLNGEWLGHPLHPLLTDLPIGFWTSAWVLDLVGGQKTRPAAELLVALGVLSALPTAASGAADWSGLQGPGRRSGLVHAVANATATTLYAMSFVARRRGRHGRGVMLGMAGAAAATVGGYLGGHLTYGLGAGVDTKP